MSLVSPASWEMQRLLRRLRGGLGCSAREQARAIAAEFRAVWDDPDSLGMTRRYGLSDVDRRAVRAMVEIWQLPFDADEAMVEQMLIGGES